MKRVARVLSVIDGLGFGGTESRLLIMGRTLDRDAFHHSILTLYPSGYSTDQDYQARRRQFREAGIQADDLAEVQSGASIELPRALEKVWRKTGILRRARALARLAKSWNIDVIDGYLNAGGTG